MRAGAVEQQRARIRSEIRRRGLRVEPFGPIAVRVFGLGVDLLVRDLADLSGVELRPATIGDR